jgi:hypothetical protein
MEIFCPACQKKLQIADSNAGQMVKCPSCAAAFQAPALPSMGPLPPPEPPVPPPAPAPAPEPTFGLLPERARQPMASPSLNRSPPEPAPISKGDYTRNIRITFRQEIVTLVPPLGLIVLFFISFFSWRPDLNLWELAFSQAGFSAFLYYILRG